MRDTEITLDVVLFMREALLVQGQVYPIVRMAQAVCPEWFWMVALNGIGQHSPSGRAVLIADIDTVQEQY